MRIYVLEYATDNEQERWLRSYARKAEAMAIARELIADEDAEYWTAPTVWRVDIPVTGKGIRAAIEGDWHRFGSVIYDGAPR